MINSLPREIKSMPIIRCLSVDDHLDVREALKANDISLYPQIITELEKMQEAETSSQLAEEFVQYLVKYFQSAPMKLQKTISEMIQSLVSIIANDDTVIQLIIKIAAATDCRLRAISPFLIKTVKNQQRLRNTFFSLTLDRVASVRIAAVQALKYATFDIRSLESLIRNAVNDRDVNVKIASVEAIADVAPHMAKEFSSLVENKAVSQKALSCIEKIVSVNGINPLYKCLTESAQHFPEETGEALLKIAKYSKNSEDSNSLILLAGQLTSCDNFMGNLYEFSKFFEDKSKLLFLLETKNVDQWRKRALILKECIIFADVFPEEMAEKAVSFSCDAVSVIRIASIALWKRLFEVNSKYTQKLELLLEEGWQARIIAAKIVGSLGENSFPHHFIEKLENDQVENVRRCIEEQKCISL